MTYDIFKAYCLAKKGVEDTYPFNGDTVWMKVAGKMFALANVDEFKMDGEVVSPFHFMNLKCDPIRAEQLREQYAAIQPGWHQNKKFWNSLYMDGSLPDDMIKELIDHSYDLVVAGLSKKERETYENL